MYVGRFIVVGENFGGYCVCSRSFPDRCVVERQECLSIELKPEAQETENPYVAYNCARVEGDCVVIGNGDHVDQIVEQLVLKRNSKDALTEGLVVSGYERMNTTPQGLQGLWGKNRSSGSSGRMELKYKR